MTNGLRIAWRALYEFTYLAVLFLAYKAVRTLVAGQTVEAFANAHQVLRVEHGLHLDIEHAVQRVALQNHTVVVALDRYYVSMHFTTTLVFLVWVFLAHRDAYPHIRRVVVATTAAALVIHCLFPLAPPRMLPSFIDTMATYGPNAYASDHVVALANQYAAMPSVHFMWAVIVGYGVVRLASTPARWLVVLHPAMTLVAIVATANHFWLDAAAGGVLVATVLAFEPRLMARTILAA